MGYRKPGWDEKIDPDRKYRGVLYTARKPLESENDLPRQYSYGDTNFLGKMKAFLAGIFSGKQSRRASGHRQEHRVTASRRASREPLFHTSKMQYAQGHRGHSPQYSPKGNRTSSPLEDPIVRTVLLLCVAVVVICAFAIPTTFAKTTTDIKINDGGREIEASTDALTVGEFLDKNNIQIGEDDALDVERTTPITQGMELNIWRGKAVTVASNGQEIEVNLIAGDVADALEKANVVPDENDEVYPSLDSYIRPGMRIEHIIVDVKERRDVRDIPYDKTTKEDSTLAKGETQIARYGETGELEIITQEVYKNGVMVSEKKMSETVIKEPITEVTSVGTYVPPPPKKEKVKTADIHKGSSGGNKTPVPEENSGGGKYTITMQVTAYCSNCNSGNKTSTGTYPSYGTVAANPGVLPYGTKLFIPGYGYGRVEDTGGFASNVIDIYMGDQPNEDACNAWGRKTITITVLE